MSNSNFDLTGRLCLVTGTTSGLGRRIALCLAGAGAEVVITGRRQDRLDALKAEIEAQGGTAHAFAFDINDRQATTAAVDAVERDIGPIWCLVNNSGITIMNQPQNHSEEDYDAVLNTNLKAPFHLSQEVGRYMIERGQGGRIINMASMGAYAQLKGGITYCMSKAALVTMTKCLAFEWARYGIKTNALCPGYIRTEMNSDYFDSERGQQDIAKWPARRLGKEEDLDGLILLLASDASDFMNGSVISVDDAQSLGM